MSLLQKRVVWKSVCWHLRQLRNRSMGQKNVWDHKEKHGRDEQKLNPLFLNISWLPIRNSIQIINGWNWLRWVNKFKIHRFVSILRGIEYGLTNSQINLSRCFFVIYFSNRWLFYLRLDSCNNILSNNLSNLSFIDNILY